MSTKFTPDISITNFVKLSKLINADKKLNLNAITSSGTAGEIDPKTLKAQMEVKAEAQKLIISMFGTGNPYQK